jgi:hypothetical protein
MNFDVMTERRGFNMAESFTEYRREWKQTEKGEKKTDSQGREIHLEVSPRLIVKGGWFDDTEIPILPPVNLSFKQKIEWLKHYAQYLIDEPEVLHDIIRFSIPEYQKVEVEVEVEAGVEV